MAIKMTPSLSWILWASITACVATALGSKLLKKDADRSLFLPGPTSNGHYQIEFACQSCHTTAFATQETLQEACETCHAEELKAAHDSHPKSKFLDPRNAERVQSLDARFCVTCHTEHRPEMEQGMGLTLPRDYCFKCHADVGSERPSHRGMAFDSCASAGCHNFHDNRALYEDYLAQRVAEPALLDVAKPPLTFSRVSENSALDADAPNSLTLEERQLAAWAASAHGKGGVNCSKCHQQEGGWTDTVPLQRCEGCHSAQTNGWQTGRHGMRTAQGLTAMTPEAARLPMSDAAHGHQLTCNSCHEAHSYDTRKAAFEACVGCHADDHTKSYQGSPHYDLWQRELAGQAPEGSGVSCATCHMPRTEGDTLNYVEHNQNANLRPNEKMVRTVCSRCHGVPFAIDALADTNLILNNFRSAPATHIASVDMAAQRAVRTP